MTRNAREFLAFIIFAAVWSIACRLFLDFINPWAVLTVWTFGLVWGVGYIISGKSAADRMALIVSGMFLVPAAVAGIVIAIEAALGA